MLGCTVEFVGLTPSPLFLFSAKDQFEKERHAVQRSWYIPSKGVRSYYLAPDIQGLIFAGVRWSTWVLKMSAKLER